MIYRQLLLPKLPSTLISNYVKKYTKWCPPPHGIQPCTIQDQRPTVNIIESSGIAIFMYNISMEDCGSN